MPPLLYFLFPKIIQNPLYNNYPIPQQSMWKIPILFLFVTLLAPASGIYIPLSGRVPRCMIVYSVGQAQTVKIDMNFPPIPGNQDDEYYEVSWKNTENNQVQMETVKSGKFKRELALTQNIIYDLCIKAVTAQDHGILHILYTATNLFAINQAQIKIPANLLKSQDITSSYLNAESIQKNLDAFIKIQSSKADTHADIFRQTNNISERLVQISVVEVVVIVAAGCYQFWVLWRYLRNKHYI